jgi:hypothetical protein
MKPPAFADGPPKSTPVAEVASARAAASGFSRRQWRQVSVITVAAIGVFALLRWLPTGTNLSHMDFRVDAPGAIEFCDPSNPQFIPVVAVASPVSLTVNAPPARAGEAVQATAMLRTASGKAIAAEDLLVVHTRKLHLLIADPALEDYQHVHPEQTRTPGEWSFVFTPRAAGTYRVFADFTPAATNRGLYAHADLAVATALAAEPKAIPRTGIAETPSAAADSAHAVERDGFRFSLMPAAVPMRAGQPADLEFTVTRLGGGVVPLRPVMDAFAHLVAFDETRSGFAHLHPAQLDLSRPPDAQQPTLDFKITIPKPGRYVIWAQVDLDGRDTFVPFWFEVVE